VEGVRNYAHIARIGINRAVLGGLGMQKAVETK